MSKRVSSRWEPIISVSKFKRRFLFGVDLRDGEGNVIKDSVISNFIDAAISYVEMEIDVPILPQDEVHREDFDISRYRQYMHIDLPVYPIVKDSVVNVSLRFTENIKIDFPAEWFRIYESAGQIELLPNVSSISSVIIGQFGQLLPRAIHDRRAPQLLYVEYKSGITDCHDRVPSYVNRVIGLCSAIYLLQMIGDIGPGGAPGISSQSISMDGLSQSVNTAISATNNLYGATIMQYSKELDKMAMPLLKRRYKRIKCEFV